MQVHIIPLCPKIPKMLTSLALKGPYHSAMILASFGFKQTADSGKKNPSPLVNPVCCLYDTCIPLNWNSKVQLMHRITGSVSIHVQDVRSGSPLAVVNHSFPQHSGGVGESKDQSEKASKRPSPNRAGKSTKKRKSLSPTSKQDGCRRSEKGGSIVHRV